MSEFNKGYDTNFVEKEIIVSIVDISHHNISYGEKFILIGSDKWEVKVRRSGDNIPHFYSKRYFVKEKDFDMYDNTNKYNV